MNHRTVLQISLSLLVGIGIGVVFTSYQSSPDKYSETRTGQNKLINKLIDYDIPPSNELGNYTSLLEDYINTALREKRATDIGVYYRDLNNGPWIGVNEDRAFIPASILKIPVMMAHLKKAEKKPEHLKTKIVVPEDLPSTNPTMTYGPKDSLQRGKEYTIEELINRMIIYSDNDAVQLLVVNTDPGEQKDLYDKLGLVYPDPKDTKPFMSTKDISRFFRVLYNATYLNEAMSEKALQILTKTSYTKGLHAGIPSDVVIADKYGERGGLTFRELHNCGIIYYPDHPYILCVMTKGSDYEVLSTIIKDISELTYKQVKESNPK
jgi:beta-lactamase class A